MTASACGVLKSSSSASASCSQEPPSSDGFRNTSRKPSARAFAASSVSSEKSIGFRQCAPRNSISSVSRPHSSIASRRDTTFPSDFDIFSPVNSSIPLCIQRRANSRPAPRDCAISFSWCGNTRSSPPPWISKTGPEVLLGHRRALDVPPRPPTAPRRVPRRVLTLLRRLPEREVARILLARVRLLLLDLIRPLAR